MNRSILGSAWNRWTGPIPFGRATGQFLYRLLKNTYLIPILERISL
jgi:hypothetical protein